MDLEENLKRYLDDETIFKLFNAINDKKTSSIILNTSKISCDEFKKMFPNIEPHPFLKNVFYYDKEEYEFGKSYLFDNGAYYIMDASSLLISHYLPIKNDDLVLDMCSAPGGKTISLVLNNLDKNFNIIANDISYPRSLELSSNIEHLGFDNVVVSNNDFSKIYKNYLEKFDKIILDAPCSGSSMFRKNENMKNDWSLQKVLRLADIQKELIEIAFSMLKKGGILSYSTCSFSYEEDEEIVLSLLNNYPDAKLIKIENRNEYFSKIEGMIHLFPHLYKGEGQFLALIQKENDKENIKEDKNKKTSPSIKHPNLLKEYNLNFLKEINLKDTIYLLKKDLPINKLNLIRIGLEAFKINKNNIQPSFALAHYLKSDNSISLNEEEKIKYLHGEEIKKDLNIKNGFYAVSFKNLNLGFVKYVDGKLKNYYPKGLRH